jgi:catechol 2,3-dioxygenase-like lactoylglutathione lyase family enzyme
VDQRLTLVTLGVRDLERSRAFYEALGWSSACEPGSDVVFFQSGGMVLALWSRERLAEDSAVRDAGGWGGVTLARNLPTPADVDAAMAAAAGAGATIGRAAGPTFWGGYSGVFIDPDGHPWEVAHNPGFHLTEDGSVHLERPSG